MIDNHEMTVVASDGYEISPVKVTHLIIIQGESIDVEVEANQAIANYWMRFRTLKDGVDFDVKPSNTIEEGVAIIHYEGAPTNEDPNTQTQVCTPTNMCTVFNCPFADYGSQYNKRCVTLNDARSTAPTSELDGDYGLTDPNFEEYFFSYPSGNSINGIKFLHPTIPMYQKDASAGIVDCAPMDCSNGCKCTNSLTLPFNKTIQMVFTNMQEGKPVMNHHPIHIHGHGFAVLKMGFPAYNATNGHWTDINREIDCPTK